MEYSFFELATKAYPIIKDKGYIKGETTNYIKNNYNDLSEKTSFVEIQDFVNWVEKRNNEKDTEYMRSLFTIIKNNEVKEYQLNLVLSGLNSYFKDKQAQEERDHNPSKFVGKIGDYISFEIKEMKIISRNYYSYRGPETIFWRLVGTDNNIYMWSTSKEDFKVGDIIAAKVKDHRDYRGEKQTIITRGKVLNQSEELPADDYIKDTSFDYTGDLLKDLY